MAFLRDLGTMGFPGRSYFGTARKWMLGVGRSIALVRRHRQPHRREVFGVMNSPKPWEVLSWYEQIGVVRRAPMSPALVCRTGTKFPNEQVRLMMRGRPRDPRNTPRSGFRAALEHVVGPQKQIESIAIGPDDDIEQQRQDMRFRRHQSRQRRGRGRAHHYVRRHALNRDFDYERLQC